MTVFQNDKEITILEPCACSFACREMAIPRTIDSSQVALLTIKSFDFTNDEEQSLKFNEKQKSAHSERFLEGMIKQKVCYFHDFVLNQSKRPEKPFFAKILIVKKV